MEVDGDYAQPTDNAADMNGLELDSHAPLFVRTHRDGTPNGTAERLTDLDMEATETTALTILLEHPPAGQLPAPAETAGKAPKTY
eukprot:jgi/Tetstr1/421333/TSEL_012304.t1